MSFFMGAMTVKCLFQSRVYFYIFAINGDYQSRHSKRTVFITEENKLLSYL